ncbi:MAG: biotin transporter BioY [Clostridia bacterium]|nr:biotin transporter BioY [Clostridia bacterium]
MKNGFVNKSAKKLALVAVFVSLMIVGAFISIPFVPVAFTMQTLFVLMAGAVLGGAEGAICVLIYIFMGLIGLPVFAGGGSGFGYVLKPTFGFMIGFVLAAFAVGLIVKKDPEVSSGRLISALFVGTLLIYACGILYYTLIQTLYFSKGVDVWSVLLYFWIIFIPSDALKGVAVFFAVKKVLPIIHRNQLTL